MRMKDVQRFALDERFTSGGSFVAQSMALLSRLHSFLGVFGFCSRFKYSMHSLVKLFVSMCSTRVLSKSSILKSLRLSRSYSCISVSKDSRHDAVVVLSSPEWAHARAPLYFA